VRPFLVVAAGLLVTALIAGGVALAVVQYESRTNPQQVNIRSGVTIAEDSAVVQAAAKAMPAVVSVVTGQEPNIGGGSGYLVTSDGYIVTGSSVIAGANGLTVLITGDATAHPARLVDYDCQTGVAVIKIDKVNALPTLAFADPTALVLGQRIVALGGPFEGGSVTPAYVSAMHRSTAAPDASGAAPVDGFTDTIEISAPLQAGNAGGPILNVAGQVVGIALRSPSGAVGGHGLNVAEVQDDVQQILQSGQLVVASLGTTSTAMSASMAALSGEPEGEKLTAVDPGGPAGLIGLRVGDVITQVDDVKLDGAHPLELLLRSRFHPSQRVAVTYTRAGASTQTELTLAGVHPSC
jgi:S1-C subfamily serine protease